MVNYDQIVIVEVANQIVGFEVAYAIRPSILTLPHYLLTTVLSYDDHPHIPTKVHTQTTFRSHIKHKGRTIFWPLYISRYFYISLTAKAKLLESFLLCYFVVLSDT